MHLYFINVIIQSTSNVMCKIALSIEGQSGSIAISCPSHHSLMEMLLLATLHPEVLTPEAAPSIIYMRQLYTYDQLTCTSLESLGLAGYVQCSTTITIVHCIYLLY
jgi:hypothetical protein